VAAVQVVAVVPVVEVPVVEVPVVEVPVVEVPVVEVPVVAALAVVECPVVECPVVECPVVKCLAVECPAAVSLENSPAGNLEILREQMAVAQREAPGTDSLLKIWIRLWMTHSTALMMLWAAPAKVPAK
jgi:hypothetical protein